MRFQDGGIYRGIVNNYVSILVFNTGIKFRFIVFSAVCNGSIGFGQLQVYNTVCNTSQSQRLAHVKGSVVVQSGDAETLRIPEAQAGSNIREAFHSYNIDRIRNRLADSGKAGIGIVAVPVIDGYAVCIGIRCIVINGGEGFSGGVQGGSVGGNDFECGAGLPSAGSGTVQSQAGFLFAAAANNSFYISRGLVNNDTGSLWLGNNVSVFSDNFVSGL